MPVVSLRVQRTRLAATCCWRCKQGSGGSTLGGMIGQDTVLNPYRCTFMFILPLPSPIGRNGAQTNDAPSVWACHMIRAASVNFLVARACLQVKNCQGFLCGDQGVGWMELLSILYIEVVCHCGKRWYCAHVESADSHFSFVTATTTAPTR